MNTVPKGLGGSIGKGQRLRNGLLQDEVDDEEAVGRGESDEQLVKVPGARFTNL
jgi:hypothetical protein